MRVRYGALWRDSSLSVAPAGVFASDRLLRLPGTEPSSGRVKAPVFAGSRTNRGHRAMLR